MSIKDYVIQIKEIKPFRDALRVEADRGVGWAFINKNGEAKLSLTVTGMIPTNGVKTVSISRLSDEQKEWLLSLPHTQVLGEAKEQYIREMTDIIWQTSGKSKYHLLHKQAPVEIDDGEGGTIIYTPPLLHCVLAS